MNAPRTPIRCPAVNRCCACSLDDAVLVHCLLLIPFSYFYSQTLRLFGHSTRFFSFSLRHFRNIARTRKHQQTPPSWVASSSSEVTSKCKYCVNTPDITHFDTFVLAENVLILLSCYPGMARSRPSRRSSTTFPPPSSVCSIAFLYSISPCPATFRVHIWKPKCTLHRDGLGQVPQENQRH